MSSIDWIDLPSDNYVAILGYETESTFALDALIKKYNDIPKDQINTLSCRIKKLGKIIEMITNWIDNHLSVIDKKKHLMWISEIATKKRNYLSKLLHIYENNLHENDAQEKYHFDTTNLYDKSAKPVYLNNHRFFSLKMREYWGDFWYESLDPCHRRVTPFLDQWKILKNANPNIPHFFLWLETQHLPKYIPCVKYLSGDELEKTRVIIKGGLFWEKSDSEWVVANFNDPAKRYLFSINLSGEIFVAEDVSGISHSSFTSGRPVIGAGLIKIKEGMLVSVALESGHYMPTLEIGYQILSFFIQKEASLPSKLEIIYFYDRNKYQLELPVEPFPTCEEFKNILELTCQLSERGCHESNAV